MIHDLGREDDAHVAEVDVHGTQVLSVPRTPSQHRDLRQVLQCLPLPPDVVHLAHDDDVLDLVEVEVGGSQRHHQVTETDERRINVSKQTNLTIRI